MYAPQSSASSSPSAQSFVKSQILVLFKQEPLLHRNISLVQKLIYSKIDARNNYHFNYRTNFLYTLIIYISSNIILCPDNRIQVASSSKNHGYRLLLLKTLHNIIKERFTFHLINLIPRIKEYVCKLSRE